MARVAPLLGSGRREVIEIRRDELDAALAQAPGPSALHDLLTSWLHEPMAQRCCRSWPERPGDVRSGRSMARRCT